MVKLWGKKGYNGYSLKKFTIADTFGGRREQVLCYERYYSKLNERELLQLLKDAKENKWETLDLSNCNIEYLPDELWEIDSLKVLYLGNNPLSEISENIINLYNLEALSISNLKEIKIPKTFRSLPNLGYLDCFGCEFQRIPFNLLNRNIKGIGIECNTTGQLMQICRIRKLKYLFLTGSYLKELPTEIGNLSSLEFLYLGSSMLESIPESMMTLKNLKIFGIDGTPLAAKVPEEMRMQTAHELISYICKQQKQEGLYCFNESKMIIVGQGNVGKSCLLERITNDNYEEKESTEGIDVKKWAYSIKKKNYILNIWDFGGQEIYHSTHQFFLTKRSLYIFVWDARAEEEYGRIDYWLKTIESFAEDSPIIIVVNKCDMNTTRVNRIDLKEYQEKYPQIQTILDISCKDNININRLRTLIKKYASNLQITKEKWLKSWYDIRIEIEELSAQRKYITYDEYLSICKKSDVGVEEAKSLSKYLHDLGIILHYQDDPFLKNIVILSPEWATSAVYKILDSQENILRKRNGVLFIKDLPAIWKDYELYPEDKYIFLLRIMEKFQLCFELNRESFLVAELLENSALDCPKGWDLSNDSCICIIYRYDFMPAGVMTRFIVKIHDYIARINGKDMCWRKGVYLKHKSAYASVVMKDTISEKKIEVKVNKNNNSIHERELLYYIRKTLGEINANFKKIQVEELVPCNCSPECDYKFPYDTLCDALGKKVEKIQCYKTFRQVNVLKLLEGIEIMKREERGPYTIEIQNNPVISNSVSIDNAMTQTNTIDIQEMKNAVREMQGDIAEMQEDIVGAISEDMQEEVKERLEKIYQDLDCVESMKTSVDVVKSGKLNKLKRWLMEFSDEDSEIRRALSGVKNIGMMIGGLLLKYNSLAEKIGITTLPPFIE